MKKFQIITGLALPIFLVFVLFRCSEESVNTQDVLVDLSIPKDLGGTLWNGVILPKGTTSEISFDGSTLKVKLPEGVAYIADYEGQFSIAFDDGYTCTSSCSGGCNVVKFGETYGCEACPEGSKESCTGQETYANRISIGKGTGGGFVNLNEGISFVRKSQKMSSHMLKSPNWRVLMNHPKVAEEFQRFYESVWAKSEIDYEKSSLVLTNVFGTYIRLYIPDEYKNKRLGDDFVFENSVSCGCSSGNSGCTHEDITAGKLVKVKVGDRCVAGACESCTMSW